MSNYEQGFLFGTIHGFFLCGRSALETYSKIKQITNGELYSQADIDECFESFRSEMHRELLQEVVDEVRRAKTKTGETQMLLDQLPFPIQREIVRQADLNSRLNLCEVSTKLENLVEIIPLHIDNLTVFYNSEYIEINSDDGFSRGYTYTNIATTGCIVSRTVENTQKHEFHNGRHYFECAAEDLMNFLKFQNLSIKTVHFIRASPIWHQGTYCQSIHDTELMLINFVSKLEGNQKIGEFSSRSDLGFAIDCLSEMKKSVCNRVIHTEFYDPHESIAVVQEFYDSDNWKNLDCFVTDGTFGFRDNHGSLADFSHFNWLRIALAEPITVDQIMEFKDMILHNSKLRQIYLIVRWSDGEFEKMNDILGIRNIDLLNGPVWTHFTHMNKNFSSLFVEEDLIVFRGPCYNEPNPRY